MINRLMAYFLIFTLLVANSTHFIMYAGFKLNQAYIVSVLCENRDKPVMKCEGKCYLNKKIKQAEEKENNQNKNSQMSHFQEAFLAERVIFSFPLKLLGEFNSAVTDYQLLSRSSAIFRPPKNQTSI